MKHNPPAWSVDAPRWVQYAAEDIDLMEIPGPATAPKIREWLRMLGAWWTDDETPWCGVAMGAWMRAAGINPPKAFYRAKAWADGWGTLLDRPIPGCVVVFDRKGGGHVGLLVGVSEGGALQILGGNQANAVNVREFPMSRNPRFIWPPGEPVPAGHSWAWAGSAGASTTEA